MNIRANGFVDFDNNSYKPDSFINLVFGCKTTDTTVDCGIVILLYDIIYFLLILIILN